MSVIHIFGPHSPPDLLPGSCGVLNCSCNRVGWCFNKFFSLAGWCSRFRSYYNFCETCGQSMTQHRMCSQCGVLVGDGHFESALSSRGMCESCRQAAKLRSRLGLDYIRMHR